MGAAPILRSIPPADYARLPRLAHPAVYICVIRDVDSDRYRFQATEHPKSYINVTLAERERDFGIELLSILETDDIVASERRLYERHHATLGDDWLALDAYQLRALRKSELRILDYSSHYISQLPTAMADADRPASSTVRRREWRAAEQSHGASHGPSISPPSPPSLAPYRYGERALRRHGAHRSSLTADADAKNKGIRQFIDDATTDLMTNHPVKCLVALALLVFVCLASYDYSCPNPRSGCPDRQSNTTSRTERPLATPTVSTYTDSFR